MHEQRINELKQALRELIQAITARGQPLSPAVKLKLAQAMEHVATRIQTLRQEQVQEAQAQP